MRMSMYISQIVFLSFITASLYAQKSSFYIGAELGLSHPAIGFTDTGNSAKGGRNINQLPLWGGEFGFQYQNFWTELGLYSHDLLLTNYNFRGFGGSWHSTGGLELGNRYGYDIKLHKIRRYYLSPHIGYRMAFTRGLENEWDRYIIDSSYYPVGSFTHSNPPYFEVEQNNGLRNGIFHLLEVGLEFSHFVIEQAWRLSLTGRYAHGIQRIHESRIYYELPEGNSGNAVYWQNGGYWMAGISLSYYMYRRPKL